MPREARLIPSGVVVHIICRFVNDDFLMPGAVERLEMARRVDVAARKTDWQVLQFAWMSTHSHWAFFTGDAPLSAFFHPLNTGLAWWLNRHHERHGPVYSARPRSLVVEGDSAQGLGAYIHNNPSRAGVVEHPEDSDWTSHRAYLGLARPPWWLNVDLGLQLMDLPSDDSGRRAFADFVAERSGDPRDANWSGGNRNQRRRRVRKGVGAPVEMATPVLKGCGGAQIEQPLVSHAPGSVHPRWEGSVREVVEAVAITMQMPVESLHSRRRTRDVVAARRVCLLVWTIHLGRAAVEMATALGIGESAASRLRSRAGTDELDLAATIASRLWSHAA